MNLLNFLPALIVLSLLDTVVRANPQSDWMIDPTPFKARVTVSRDGREVELNNGLLRRVIRLQPNAATVGLDNLVNGESLLRGELAKYNPGPGVVDRIIAVLSL